MIMKPSTSSASVVREGVYEITDSASGQYLNTIEAAVYNRYCDDALILQDQPTRLGKWEIRRIGQGYTIKQVSSGLYCALADSEQLLSQSVILSPVPTVWSITYVNVVTQTVYISWSISRLCWDTPPTGQGRLVSMGQLVDDSEKSPGHACMTWRLNAVGPNTVAGPIMPGIYALQNKASETFVSLSPDESTVSCWPADQLEKTGVKLWEILPLGEGFTIRLHGTDKYITLQAGMTNRAKISVSKVPAAWRIVAAESPILSNEGYVQIYWADTTMGWDLAGHGKRTPGTAVELVQNKDYQPCRLFKLIA